MHIFLSYATPDRTAAEPIHLALAEQGHDVFFDREDLPPGEAFDTRIRRAIQSSDLVVFLLSPDAVDAGSYTLTELDIVRSTWQHPGGRLLPVLLRPVAFDAMPAYLKAVTILHPHGNVAAEVAHAVEAIQRRRVRRRLALSVLAAVLLATAAACGLFLWPQRDPASAMTAADGAQGVLVPAGTFTMGDDEEAPLREIYLDAFYIDRHEVTTARYARFLTATGSVRPPEGWEAVNAALHGELPVTGVDWNDAAAYCRWAKGRLPTEAEWEKAARGADQRRFPWGNEEATLERANHANASPETYDGGLQPVGRLPRGASPYGVHDLAGNAAEWVADWHADALERGDLRNPRGPPAGTSRVIRGGGRFDPAYRVTATKRYHANPDTRLPDLGFRCARDAG